MSVAKGRVRSSTKVKGVTLSQIKKAQPSQLRKLSAATSKVTYLSTQGIAYEIFRQLEASDIGEVISKAARNRIKAAMWKKPSAEQHNDAVRSHSFGSYGYDVCDSEKMEPYPEDNDDELDSLYWEDIMEPPENQSASAAGWAMRDAMSRAAYGIDNELCRSRKIFVVSWSEATGTWVVKMPTNQWLLHELNPARIIKSSFQNVLNRPEIKNNKSRVEQIELLQQECGPLLRELEECMPNAFAAVKRIVELQQAYFNEAVYSGKDAPPGLLSYCSWESLARDLGWDVSFARKRLSAPNGRREKEAPILFLASSESAGEWLLGLSQSDMPSEEFSWNGSESPAGGVITGPILLHTLACQSGRLMTRAKTTEIIRLIERIKEIKAENESYGHLSDQKIADKLTQEGYQISGRAVARRTVAKYRDLAGIQSSRLYPKERKRVKGDN